MRCFRLVVSALLLSACAPEPLVPPTDLCEQAARHREACTGDYVTPPICDEDTEAAAEYMLELDCSQIEQLGAGQGKADGAFCDWFGWGCTADEDIFDGPSCSRDSDCFGSAYCVERHCFGGIGSDDLTAILDGLTGSRETGGNFTHHLVDNVETYELRRMLMQSAAHSIHLSALVIHDDETGYETAGILADAAQRGVEVRIIVDATTQYLFADYDVLDQIAAAGGEVIPYNPITEWAWLRWQVDLNANQRLHEKLLVVDGVHAVVGGRNVGDDYLQPNRWRDSDVYIAGPVVEETQYLFLSLWDQFGGWEQLAGCPQQDDYGYYCPRGELPLAGDAAYYPGTGTPGTARARIVSSDPRLQDSPHGYISTIALVRAARRSIKITNSYFVPPRRLRKHLKAAARRGVDVVVVTNSLESTDAWYMYYASLNYYEELIKAGVQIRQYRGTETMHAKTMVVDDTLALIGSYNLDPRSATSNSEAMVLVRDGAAVAESVAVFDIDSAYADEAHYEDISWADWLKAKAFRLPEPLM